MERLRRIGVLGDVHAEDERLEAALALFDSAGVDRVVCVGDVVDGLGDVSACIQLLRSRDVLVVRGNHERWLLEGTMRHFADATLDLPAPDRAWVESLQPTHELLTVRGSTLLCHGLGPHDMVRLLPEDEGYALETNEELTELLARDYALVLCGHTHRRMVRRFGATTIVNAGTLLRHMDPCVALVDTEEGAVWFHDYDGLSPRSVGERVDLV